MTKSTHIWGFSAATARVAAILAIGLLTSAPSVRPAQAVDLARGGINARLVFSPTAIAEGQTAFLCAVNLNATTVSLELLIRDLVFGTHNTDHVVSIPPGEEGCATLTATIGFSALGSIVLNSPVECSQAIEYPGKCRVLGSLQIADDPFGPIRIHVEPVLLPGTPGNPKLTNFPQ